MSLKIQNPVQFRENIRNHILTTLNANDILQKIAEKHSIEPNIVAINLEKGVFNYTIRECTFRKLVKKWENTNFIQIYIDRLRMVYSNLSSPTIVEGLISGDILPQSVAFMTHQEILPDKWNPLIEKKTKRDASKCDKKVGASTAMFTCSRCQSKNCTYYEMQTRSADEPATIFITCLNCDKHWRN